MCTVVYSCVQIIKDEPCEITTNPVCLQSALGSQVSTHLSGVASPTDALSKLKQEFAGRVHEVTPSTKVVDLPMSDEGHDMLVVNLPATTKGQIGNTLKTSGMLSHGLARHVTYDRLKGIITKQ